MPPETQAHSDADHVITGTKYGVVLAVPAEYLTAGAVNAGRALAHRTQQLVARIFDARDATDDGDAERQHLDAWTDAEPFGIPHAVLDCTPAADDVADPAGVEQPSWPTCSACGCCLEHAPGQCVAVHTALCRTCSRNPRVDGV